MCICVGMCWDFGVITDNGRWPVPKHHPNCKEHKSEKFITITANDTRCTMELKDALDYIADSDDAGYTIELNYISRDQFENLPEFTGF